MYKSSSSSSSNKNNNNKKLKEVQVKGDRGIIGWVYLWVVLLVLLEGKWISSGCWPCQCGARALVAWTVNLTSCFTHWTIHLSSLGHIWGCATYYCCCPHDVPSPLVNIVILCDEYENWEHLVGGNNSSNIQRNPHTWPRLRWLT